ncbi:UDP-GlcNAc3NAcA epimerase [Salinibacillus kushneri]|uniref:UDP-GlcNAc3NAcA epimerase n=1 Tax=Salinibacillus kushneri TaxID=237682 RepID=A0A1I0AJ22_9BACI|nr:UDP-N-acetylglucosamine 2-epimerase (non-hydrolyzing) [Salinibacillus kushneri]SES93268.1 UDP-GlcNAc3NAcA epimerase [Salinibacillus kushneri]
MKILTVVGARPQFIKSSMLSKAVQPVQDITEIIVHTGQHYDEKMSNVFFNQLKLPKPDYYLGVGSSSHGKQTAQMLEELETIIQSVKPDVVLVYGDTNTTLAGSLAAAKLHIPIAHVEAGLRSYNKEMPEEINRQVTDHLSSWLFCPTASAVENLDKEGITEGVYITGDIMYDAVLYFKDIAFQHSSILETLHLSKKDYYLVTIHRAENTDNPERLKSILKTLQQLEKNVIFPLHPRTKKKIEQFNLTNLLSYPIKTVDPFDYFDMLTITSQARMVLTDSGGLQKEAYMLQVPCITLRDETEWTETLQFGWNQLAGTDQNKILNLINTFQVPNQYPQIFGSGKTAEEILTILTKK